MPCATHRAVAHGGAGDGSVPPIAAGSPLCQPLLVTPNPWGHHPSCQGPPQLSPDPVAQSTWCDDTEVPGSPGSPGSQAEGPQPKVCKVPSPGSAGLPAQGMSPANAAAAPKEVPALHIATARHSRAATAWSGDSPHESPHMPTAVIWDPAWPQSHQGALSHPGPRGLVK